MSAPARPGIPRLSREALVAQFRGLDPRDPGVWPLLPRLAAWAAALLLVLVAGALAVLSDEFGRLERERAREPALQKTYRDKLAQAVNLAPLRQRKQLVQQQVQELERQLPRRSEMDALLSDLADAARRRDLGIEIFRPGALQLREHHAELPITLRLSGRYHDIGAFAADVARLPRIVALHDLQLTAPTTTPREPARNPAAGPARGGTPPADAPPVLSFEATALTYRALEPAELAEQQRRREAEKAGARRSGAAGAKP